MKVTPWTPQTNFPEWRSSPILLTSTMTLHGTTLSAHKKASYLRQTGKRYQTPVSKYNLTEAGKPKMTTLGMAATYLLAGWSTAVLVPLKTVRCWCEFGLLSFTELSFHIWKVILMFCTDAIAQSSDGHRLKYHLTSCILIIMYLYKKKKRVGTIIC